MFCEQCGAPIPEGARFCEQCGAPVPQEAAPVAPVAQPEPEATPVPEPDPQPVHDSQMPRRGDAVPRAGLSPMRLVIGTLILLGLAFAAYWVLANL